MIDLLATRDSSPAARLLLAAFRRSVSQTQARPVAAATMPSSTAGVAVAVDPDGVTARNLMTWLEKGGRKLLLFGTLPDELISGFGFRRTNWPDRPDVWSRSPSAPLSGCSESRGAVRYTSNADRFRAHHWRRPMERFDFADEWNNLGYGAIRADGSIWSLAAPLEAPAAQTIATVDVDGAPVASYSALFDLPDSSVLWFNRSVGPIDSFEWRLVELFLSSWRYGELPCQPVLQEIPWGHDAAVTMRLDCDEDVESSRTLMELYRELSVPFSLAVHTSNLACPKHHRLLKELAGAGGSILSHSATHAPEWGGSYEAAVQEGLQSARLLQSVTGRPVRYAVSPFHHSPPYALAALADTGYSGCVGGIIRNDPEFMLARGGHLAGLPEGFIGHSQQVMLHGDCLLDGVDGIAVYRQSFDLARETRTLFGYLDHPFSERYQYGWRDEALRTSAHRRLIAHIRATTATPLFLSEEAALDFLLTKAAWRVIDRDGGYRLLAPAAGDSGTSFAPTVDFGGRYHEANDGGIFA